MSIEFLHMFCSECFLQNLGKYGNYYDNLLLPSFVMIHSNIDPKYGTRYCYPVPAHNVEYGY